MMRKLYQCLLLMHPPLFRRRFAAEMLCIFDEAALSTGAFNLIVDAVASLAANGSCVRNPGSWPRPSLALACRLLPEV